MQNYTVRLARSTLLARLGLGWGLMLGGTISAEAQCNVQQLAKLLPKDGAAGDCFGGSVAINGATTLVGARYDDDQGDGSGSAYVFDTTTRLQVAKLLPKDGAAGDWFGGSVAISGTTAIVGAYYDDENGYKSGSAYLFDVGTGQQLAKLLPGDGAAYDYFGECVAISGKTAIVGAWGDDDKGSISGSAYLFDVTTGQQTAKLVPEDGAAYDYFGGAVAINGTTAIVAAWGDSDNGKFSGSAYVFDATTGTQLAKLLPQDGAADDHFGGSVAINGKIAIVGACWDDDNGEQSGSAYLFDVSTGRQLAKLRAQDGAASDQFGRSVAISGTTAIVGAVWDEDNGYKSGSAYLFDVTTGQQLAKLLPNDGATHDRFGVSVAISGATAIVGSIDNNHGQWSGSAYLFQINRGE